MPHAARKIELQTSVLRILHPESHRTDDQKRDEWKNREHDEKGHDRLHCLKKSVGPEYGKGNDSSLENGNGVGHERKRRSVQNGVSVEVIDRAHLRPSRVKAEGANGQKEICNPNAEELRTASREMKCSNRRISTLFQEKTFALGIGFPIQPTQG